MSKISANGQDRKGKCVVAKRTPLYQNHMEHQAKVIDFHGWEMPVQYKSIVQEHHAVRTGCGVFDVSHMGEFLVEGTQALEFVQYLVTNDVRRLQPGHALYTLMTDDHGGTIDDLLVYQLDDNRLMLVVNAGNIGQDLTWVQQHAVDFDVTVNDISDDVALIAVQGPVAQEMLQTFTDFPLEHLKSFTFQNIEVLSKKAMVSRTGYTGEDGFEVYLPSADAPALFEALLGAGATPCGLGARDTLRLEARLPLYGNELSPHVTPLEAGLSFFVKLDNDEFVGKSALVAQKEAGVQRKLIGITMDEKAIPRSGYAVWSDGQKVGEVTSGTLSPTLQKPIGLALIEAKLAQVGQALEVEIRGKRHPAHVVKSPFYKRAPSQ